MNTCTNIIYKLNFHLTVFRVAPTSDEGVMSCEIFKHRLIRKTNRLDIFREGNFCSEENQGDVIEVSPGVEANMSSDSSDCHVQGDPQREIICPMEIVVAQTNHENAGRQSDEREIKMNIVVFCVELWKSLFFILIYLSMLKIYIHLWSHVCWRFPALTQCAAVTTCLCEISAPPQTCENEFGFWI